MCSWTRPSETDADGPGNSNPKSHYFLDDVQATDFPFATPATHALISTFVDLRHIHAVTIALLQGLTLAHVFDEFGTPVQIVRENGDIELVYDNDLLAFIMAEDLEHVDAITILTPDTPRAYPDFSRE